MPKEPEYFSKQVTDARRWFLELPKPREKGIVTISVGCERCLPEYVVERDTFDYECLEFVAEGSGTLRLNGRNHRLQPGESKAGGGRCIRVGDVEEVSELFELLIRNAMSETDFSQGICGALVEALLQKITEKTIQGAGADTRAWATYQRIRRHVQAHFLRLRTMDEVAKETGVDPAYLSRVFRRYHRMTPYRFLVRLKMRYAASLLLNPETLVKEVAHELGFSDPFHFSRSFKSVYGVSPEGFAGRGGKR